MAEKRTADSILSGENQAVVAKRARLECGQGLEEGNRHLTNGVANGFVNGRHSGGAGVAPTMNGPPVPAALYVNNNARVGPTPAGSAPSSGPPLPSAAIPMEIYRNLNNQAMPVAQSGSSASINAGAAANVRTSNDAAGSSAPRPAGSAGAPPSYSSSGANSEQTPSSRGLVIDVHQIRVGVRKFLPMPNSSVLFKDEGVLFTLKEYPNAPLLLNARAIQQCKANLTSQMSALFFYLEGSCIKQIRNIFKMHTTEFSEKATDRASTIALFPTTMDNTKAQGIRNAFDVMQRKYNRPQHLLKEVSVHEIVDLMYSHPSTSENPAPVATTTRASQPVSGPPPLQSISNNRPNVPNTVNTYQTQMPAASNMLRQMQAAASIQNQMYNPMISHRVPLPTATLPHAATQQPQGTLILPENSTQEWNAVKSKLQPGGLYAVQTPDGQKQYRVWNGSALVPCSVQNQEVQLKCDFIRIGSMRYKSVDTVRIRKDWQNSGIYFKVLNPSTRTMEEIIISQNELSDCVVCFSPIPIMFVYPTDSCATKIQLQCKMSAIDKDPYYHPFAKEERRRHLILFLRDVNADQKDSLVRMKRTGTADRYICRQIEGHAAQKILSDIKQNTNLTQSRITDHFGKALESLARELQNPDLSDMRSNELDDNDDDVVIEQEEIGVKCPYTQKVMKEPIKNKLCGHNYEKAAILEFIMRRKAKGNARCPYAGCGNQKPLTPDDLVDNADLRQHIQREILAGRLTA